MNFERGKGIKSSVGIGVEATYKPIHIGNSFILKYRLKGREGQPVQSLFGPERGHKVLNILGEEHPNREDLQKLTAIKTPITELVDIRLTVLSPESRHFRSRATELSYLLGYVYDVDPWMREVVLKHGDITKLPFRTEKTSELPVLFDGKLHFIRVVDVF
jgi:hypothetical protein